MSLPFVVSPLWAKSTGEAIGARNGISLKDALVAAERGEAVQLCNDSPTTISDVVDTVYEAVTSATRAYWVNFPLQTCHASGRHQQSSSTIGAAVEKERELATEVALRVAITGALVVYQRANGIVNRSSHEADDDCSCGNLDATSQPYHNTLLKGLLHAFNAFLEMHSMPREHYPPRTNHRTPGTVGWDTLVLLHFVHHIPQTARYASGAIIDDATGQIVRGWRRLLVALQSIDAAEAPQHSRRRGALALANGLLILLFQRYNTQQCAALLKAIDHAEQATSASGDTGKSILKPSQHITSEVVTYYYYKGRMCLYESRPTEAHAALSHAYSLLPQPGTGTVNQQRNKQRVRFFLMVAGTISGYRVPLDIAQHDSCLSDIFSPLVETIERGDPVAFTLALEHHGTTWRRRGVYLILQQAKILCFLMLLARVHTAIGSVEGADNSRITLAQLVRAYHHVVAVGKVNEIAAGGTPRLKGRKHVRTTEGLQGEEEDELVAAAVTDMDDDRMTLWVAKLIAHGYVRGYVSHEHKTLVLSKKDPFPLLGSALNL